MNEEEDDNDEDEDEDEEEEEDILLYEALPINHVRVVRRYCNNQLARRIFNL